MGITLTPQQERLLTYELSDTPKTYCKASVIQSLVIDLCLNRKSVSKSLGVSVSTINCYVSGYRVVSLDMRPERKRLKAYLRRKVKSALITIKIFKLHDTPADTFILTLGDDDPDKDGLILFDGYLRDQNKKDIRYKVRGGHYHEVDLLQTPYINMSVKQILKKTKSYVRT